MLQEVWGAFGWWVSVIEIPVVSGLFWMIWTMRREHERALDRITHELAEHKLEVARYYAPTRDLRTLEGRITSHLLRIEAKLDVTALKAEALQASSHSKSGFRPSPE
ncbi:MAG: hypothetical protein JNN09_00970 [Alphaproteobacteria bacterium]|nr:hypothetical protein [Alphaproteobacteria bacterium]